MNAFARRPWLLYSYIATEMLSPFFASFLIMNCVFFLVRLVPFLNAVLEMNIGFADFIRLFSYLFPNMFLYSIPMAAMMGVIICFTRLSNDSEILAFKACGISVYQMLPPVVVVATIISLITGYFSIQLIPAGDTAMRQLMFQLAKEKIDKGIKDHQFTEALGDLVLYVERIDRNTGLWHDVWVSDMRGQKMPVITMAKTGRMHTDIKKMQVTIILKNGSMHRSSTDQGQIVSFDRYRLYIPIQPQNQDIHKIDRGAMSMAQLLKLSKKLGVNTPGGRECLVHYNKRLSLPISGLLLCLIGMALGLQSGPGKPAIGIPMGLGFYIVYYIIFTLGKQTADTSTLPVSLMIWSSDIVFLPVTVYMIWRTANEEAFIPERLKKILAMTSDHLKSLWKMVLVTGVFQARKKEVKVLYSDELIAQLSPTGKIHGNAKSRVFHLPECEFYNCKNCTLEFKDLETAFLSGFEPCRFCKELLGATIESSTTNT